MERLIEKYSEVPPNQRYMMAFLVLAALIAGHYYLIYSDQQEKLDYYRDQYSDQENIRKQKQNVAQNRSRYEAKLEQLENQLDEARARLPDSADVPELQAQLGDRERMSGITILDFQPVNEVKKGFYSQLGFNLKVRGTYHEIGMFIDAISKLDRIIHVTDIKLQNPKTDSSKIEIDGTFKVKTYRFVSSGGKAQGKKT